MPIQRQNLRRSRAFKKAFSPIDLPGKVAWYQNGQGITTGSSDVLVSQWDDVWNDNHLLQSTGTKKPAFLEHSGTNYLWLPGVAGNYASTPDAAALDILGDFDLRAKVALDDWTPATNAMLVAKWDVDVVNENSYRLFVGATGKLRIQLSGDGTNIVTVDSTVAVGFTNGTVHWVKVTVDVDNGSGGKDIKFWTSDDNVTYTQLGTTVVDAGTTAIYASNVDLYIGVESPTSVNNITIGKLYQAQVYDGIDGTLVFDADFTAEAEGTTSFTESSAQGATVTVNSTGGWLAQIVGSTSILFDGDDNYLKATAFTLNQPTTVYFLGRQVTWSNAAVFYGGDTAVTPRSFQISSTPRVAAHNGGTNTSHLTTWAVDTYAVFSVVFDSTTAITLQLNNNASVIDTTSLGSNAWGGFTLGSEGGGGSSWSNIQVKEVIIYNVAHNAVQRHNVIQYLLAKN